MPAADALARRLAVAAGTAMRDERQRRGITTRQLAHKARLSAATINALEAGQRVSLDAYARVAVALGLSLELVAQRRRPRERSDLVYAAMGEFAGRADVLAWSEDPAALLHIEKRSLFPDPQQAAGSYDAKR